jgi:FkbM family methyltransferase
MSISLEHYEKLNPKCELDVEEKKLIFSTPTIFTLWRVESLFTKEPWTIEWLNELTPEDLLLDVGANVGMYTIWAAAIRHCRVIAIEPESTNYSILNKNILQNNLDKLVQAYSIGLSNVNEFCMLNMADLRAGGSNHAAGEALNFNLKPMSAKFQQGCVVFALDELIDKKCIPVPSRIKIDVDGFEHKVISGARKTLQHSNVKSLLIETNTNLSEHKKMVQDLENLGFKFSPEQVARAIRKSGTFEGVAEYVFRR